MLKKIILLFMLFISISCTKKQKVETQIYDCLALKIDKRPVGNSEDFINYLKEMESFTIKDGFLLNSTMEGYLSFFENLYYKENQAKKVFESIDEFVLNDFNFNLGMIYLSYKECHTRLDITDNVLINKINEKLEIYDKLESTGFEDYESLVRLINSTNFKSDIDRLMLFNVLQMFAYNKGVR